MYTPKKTVKEKAEVQEAFEKPKVVTDVPVVADKASIKKQLEILMFIHRFPDGWKREIMSILKPVLQ